MEVDSQFVPESCMKINEMGEINENRGWKAAPTESTENYPSFGLFAGQRVFNRCPGMDFGGIK